MGYMTDNDITCNLVEFQFELKTFSIHRCLQRSESGKLKLLILGAFMISQKCLELELQFVLKEKKNQLFEFMCPSATAKR